MDTALGSHQADGLVEGHLIPVEARRRNVLLVQRQTDGLMEKQFLNRRHCKLEILPLTAGGHSPSFRVWDHP